MPLLAGGGACHLKHVYLKQRSHTLEDLIHPVRKVNQSTMWMHARHSAVYGLSKRLSRGIAMLI